MFKRLISLTVVVGILVSSFISVSAVAKDDEPSSWAKDKVAQAIKLGMVPVKIQGKYKQSITREEFASLFVNSVFTF